MSSQDQTPASHVLRTGGGERLEGEHAGLEREIVAALRTVFDPEIPVNVYDMGLVYGIVVGEGGAVEIEMTLTSPMCPVAETLPPEVEAKVAAIDGVKTARVSVVWEPIWYPDGMMSEAARLELNMF